MKDNILYKIFALFVCVMTTMQLSAQSVRAELDSTTIFVGGQVGLTIQASYPETENMEYVQLQDTVTKSIEIVEATPIDTTRENGMVVLHQRYIVTSFDTALHYIPPFEVLRYEGGSAKTSDMSLNVINPFQTMEVDQQTGVAKITDIKDPQDTPFIFSELLEYIWWFIGGLLLVILIVVAVIWYRKHRAKHTGGEVKVQKPKEPCHVIALRELEQIKEEKLWQRNLFKEYYSNMTDVLRRYIENRYGLNAMESTSDEILDMMKRELKDDSNNLKRLETILSLADLVKFAKMEPLPDENDMSIKYAIEIVKETAATNNVTEEAK